MQINSVHPRRDGRHPKRNFQIEYLICIANEQIKLMSVAINSAKKRVEVVENVKIYLTAIVMDG